MQLLRDTVPNLYLFSEPHGTVHFPQHATLVRTWAEIIELLIVTH